MTTSDEEDNTEDWMMDFDLEMRVSERIACPEKGYPLGEARFVSTTDWENHYHEKWNDYLWRIM